MMTRTTTELPLRTTFLTGLAYLATAITGGVSYLGIRPRLLVAEDAPATMSRLIDNESLARLGQITELGLAASGTVTALLFFALFRRTDPVSAGAIVVFAILGAFATLLGTVFSGVALEVAVGGLDTNGDPADLVLLLLQLKEMAWSVGALAFGLWLLPMGWLTLRSGWMPRLLGWALITGGVGYLLSAVVDQARPEASTLVEALTAPANIAEFSMLVYLLVRGSLRTST